MPRQTDAILSSDSIFVGPNFVEETSSAFLFVDELAYSLDKEHSDEERVSSFFSPGIYLTGLKEKANNHDKKVDAMNGTPPHSARHVIVRIFDIYMELTRVHQSHKPTDILQCILHLRANRIIVPNPPNETPFLGLLLSILQADLQGSTTPYRP
ncbi:unnamed protein product [Penicillium roqueforti FM164]|uniref:Uncharacterized protein n=1 Tax=Penicillium roqueforti (strain FM164) TaxID=1365484 RepID=W6R981_PENRF|nr:unnamed protein product [Penicillium roqueforti FM164]